MKISQILLLRNIYLLSTLHCLVLIIACGVQWYDDTLSYIKAWDVISSLQIDMWRTPVYPIFLGMLNFLFGNEHYLFCGIIVQHLIFLISIYYFYCLVGYIIKSQTVVICATAFYALYPCVTTWNCFLLTEPFAIYGTVFMLFCSFKAYCTNSILYILYYAFWTIFLIFLRPAQIYILPVFFVGWLLLYLKERHLTRVVVGGIITVCISVLILFFYCQCYKHKYGLFTPSGVGVTNKYYIARLDGDLKPEHTSNVGLKQFLKETIIVNGQIYNGGTSQNLYLETEKVINLYGLKEVSDLVSNAVKYDFVTYVRRFMQRFHKAANDKLFATYIHTWKNVTDLIGVSLKTLYWLLFLFPLLLMHNIKERKYIPWFTITLYILGCSHLFLIIFTCQNVWDRLVIPAVPIYIILFALFFDSFGVQTNSNEEYV